MKLIGNKALASIGAATLFIAATAVIAPSGATTGTFAMSAARQIMRHDEGGANGNHHLVRAPRATRIANCLRDARNTANQMALQCEQLHPINKKGLRPGLSDCRDQVLDWWRIEEASCKRIR